jgi:thiol-disulfide isomerase/thioredoxin
MTIIQNIICVILVGFISCNSVNENNPVVIPQPDREIDKIKLTDLKNEPVDLNQYAGKTIFINIWATWCKPCLQEMPSIEKAQNILRNKNIVFLLASAEAIEEIDTFRKLHAYPFNYVQIQNSEELGIQSLPTTFIFNKKGKLVFSESGYRKWDDKNNIDTILKIIYTNE